MFAYGTQADEQLTTIINELKTLNKDLKTLEKAVYEQDMYDSIETIDHAWKYGDMYWKLSSFYYGDPEFWWVIAGFNKKPTEAHNKIGDTIKIPIRLSDALQVVE